MQLNSIPLVSYETGAASAAFVLECTFQEAMKLDGKELKITNGDTEYAVFGGYHLTGLEQTVEGHTRASFAKVIAPDVAQSISALEQNLAITNRNLVSTNGDVQAASDKADNAQSAADAASQKASSLSESIEANAAAIEEIAAAVFAE